MFAGVGLVWSWGEAGGELQKQVGMEGICSEKTNKSCETAWDHPGWLSNAPKTLPSAEIKVLRRDWNPPHSSMGGSRGVGEAASPRLS